MAVVRDLGRLEGDVLLFGGPYSNLQATQALFAAAGHIPMSNRICTGDVVAYCADALATWDLVQAGCAAIVAGNCEKQLAEGAEDCGCGFEEGSLCDLASRGWYPYAAAQMAGREARLAACPDVVVFTHEGRRYAAIHGGISDISRFIWPTCPQAVLQFEINALQGIVGDVDGVICGHCGIAFERVVNGCQWINAGVIGMPPHDGRPETRYAVLGADGARFHTLGYDAAAASSRMQEQGLTQGYEEALLTGIWPSQDVLPVGLRQRVA